MTELRVRRSIPATPERVWRAFTTPEIGAWMWPPTWATTADVDLRVRGRYRIASEAVGMGVAGEFVAIEPTHRLVQTWKWDGEDEETLVTIGIEADGEGPQLTIVHERFGDEQSRRDHDQGWNDCLDRLGPHLAG